MSNKNKDIVRRYIETILNTGDTNLISDFIAEDYVEIHDGKKYELGIPGAIIMWLVSAKHILICI